MLKAVIDVMTTLIRHYSILNGMVEDIFVFA